MIRHVAKAAGLDPWLAVCLILLLAGGEAAGVESPPPALGIVADPARHPLAATRRLVGFTR